MPVSMNGKQVKPEDIDIYLIHNESLGLKKWHLEVFSKNSHMTDKEAEKLKAQILEALEFYKDADVDLITWRKQIKELKDKAEKYMKIMDILSLKEGVDEFEYIKQILGESQ